MGNTEKNTKAKKTKEIAQADAPDKDVSAQKSAENVKPAARIRAENMV